MKKYAYLSVTKEIIQHDPLCDRRYHNSTARTDNIEDPTQLMYFEISNGRF